MHEMSLAIQIVDIALSEGAKAGARRISAIEIEVGELAGVMAEALDFCLEAAARETLAEGAAFVLVAIPGLGYCPACAHEVPVSAFPAQCPQCQGFGVVIRAGGELRLRSISIDEE